MLLLLKVNLPILLFTVALNTWAAKIIRRQKITQKFSQKNRNCHKTRFRQTLSAGKRHLHEKPDHQHHAEYEHNMLVYIDILVYIDVDW